MRPENHVYFIYSEFIRRYEADEFEETLEFAEWMGEYRLLEKLHEKMDTLQGIQFATR